jgi:hypothetical protein
MVLGLRLEDDMTAEAIATLNSAIGYLCKQKPDTPDGYNARDHALEILSVAEQAVIAEDRVRHVATKTYARDIVIYRIKRPPE